MENRFCKNCGNELKVRAAFCPNCGEKRDIKQRSKVTAADNGYTSSNESNKKVNVTFATIIGYFIPGLPPILWFNQKKKGWSLIGVTVAGFLIFQIFGNIVIGVLGVVDAYQLSNRLNKGEHLDEWAFFWNRRKSS